MEGWIAPDGDEGDCISLAGSSICCESVRTVPIEPGFKGERWGIPTVELSQVDPLIDAVEMQGAVMHELAALGEFRLQTLEEGEVNRIDLLASRIVGLNQLGRRDQHQHHR